MNQISLLINKKGVLISIILAFALFLRVWQIDKVPVSLFGDEVDMGYHAYSLYKTGKDYTGHLLPLNLKSLADYKAPLFGYSITPFVALFGISPLGVRLPSVIFGVIGIYFLFLIVNLVFKNRIFALLSAFFLAISPWHMHYSRWGFEGTEMLALYSAGLYCFLKSFSNGKWLVATALLFGLTTLSYHSAKVFVPLSILALLIIYFKKVANISKKYLIASSIAFLLTMTPFIISMTSGGLDRFQATSILRAPTLEGEIGALRVRDNKMEVSGSQFFHNKITYFSSIIINNYLSAFSTEFLFIKGDPEPTHTPSGFGEFYKFEALFMLLGLVFLFLEKVDRKIKAFLIFWILAAPLPSILTIHGGFHASRLLFLLPPLVILIALGVYRSYFLFKKIKTLYIFSLACILLISLVFYQHNYFVHYPWDSERWWHAGFKEAIRSAVSEGEKYDKVIISGADEPPLIFFLAWSMYDPLSFQQKYPLAKYNLDSFGEVEKLDKYYFPPIGVGRGLYELGSVLPEKTLYLATAKEIKLDLVKEPSRVPSDLILIKSILYPSGEPVFYLFTKNEKSK